MSFFKDLFGGNSEQKSTPPTLSAEARIDTEIAAIFRMLADTMGTERLVIQAGKMNAMALMRSDDRRERVLASCAFWRKPRCSLPRRPRQSCLKSSRA